MAAMNSVQMAEQEIEALTNMFNGYVQGGCLSFSAIAARCINSSWDQCCLVLLLSEVTPDSHAGGALEAEKI